MTAGLQCDSCRAFSAAPSGQWLHLVPHPEPVTSALSALFSPSSPMLALTFCSVRCVSAYTTAQVLIEETGL